jgi:hypothetical protein
MPLLHIPIDFELGDGVRRLALKVNSPDRALAIAFRLWSDWGRVAREWRPLDFASPEGSARNWDAEPLCHILEQYCQWGRQPGEPAGELIPACLSAGILTIQRRGDIEGLVLANFWRCNEHLSPDHKTMQQRGGRAKAAMARMREAENLAVQQVRLFEVHQGDLPLVSEGDASQEELKRATALVMRLDVACDLPQRHTNDFGGQLMKDALVVVRAYTFEDVDCVCRFLLRHADNPEIVREPALILPCFGDLLRKAQGL